MTIQLNADRNLNIREGFAEKLKEMLNGGLDRFGDRISRLEVHLSDENAGKEGINDKKCLLEARLEGMQPVVVSGNANDYERAVNLAVLKMKTSLDKIIGRLMNY